jgi:hypothetical protein
MSHTPTQDSRIGDAAALSTINHEGLRQARSTRSSDESHSTFTRGDGTPSHLFVGFVPRAKRVRGSRRDIQASPDTS